MATDVIKLSSLKENGKNPRIIKDASFAQLKQSITEFPKMMELRPIIVDEQNRILAGRQRRAALVDLGYKEIPRKWVKKATELTDEEKQRFMLMDNHHAGDWDYAVLAKEWNLDLAKGWGIDFNFPKADLSVSFSATKREKGTLLKVQCKTADAAAQLATELLGRGLDVEIK